jgi:hypothetical protein
MINIWIFIIIYIIAWYLAYKLKISGGDVFLISTINIFLIFVYIWSISFLFNKPINISNYVFPFVASIILLPSIIFSSLSIVYIRTYHTNSYWSLFFIGGIIEGTLGILYVFILYPPLDILVFLPIFIGAFSPIIFKFMTEKGVQNDH